MVHLLNQNFDAARPNVGVLVSGISVHDFVAVNGAFLNIDVQRVQAINESVSFADMTGRSFVSAFTIAGKAPCLELLHKPWSDLLFRNDLSCTVAIGACFEVIRIVSP